jgi:hypothetical protein
MFLGDLLGMPVLQDGRQVGFVNDVRLFVPDHTPGQQVGTPQVYGVVVCPRRASSFVGYERSRMNEPRALAALFGWRTRGSFLVLWTDLLMWAETGVELRPDATRWSPSLA